MTTVSPKNNHDPARVNEISEKLMENPELSSLISELSTSAEDASELVKGLLQASINAGLQAEMDAHLGYGHSDRKTKAQVETAQENNHRNGSYTKTVNSGYGGIPQSFVDCVVGTVSVGVSVPGMPCEAAMSSVLVSGEVAASPGPFLTSFAACGLCALL